MGTIRFLHMSDLHYREQYADNGFEALIAARQHPKDNIIKCIREERENGFDFLLLTGDLTHEGEKSDCLALDDLLKKELGNIPYIALPGNHDIREAFSPVFNRNGRFEGNNGVYKIKGLRIIVLDTGRSVNGLIEKEQITWLKEALKEPSPEGSLLALHHPLIDNQNGLPCAQYDGELKKVIAGSDILGIFCGHTHHNYMAQFAGKPYFTADSMAFSMVTHKEVLTFKNHAAYTVMELRGKILSAQVKQTVPEISVTASFSSDKLSQLFSQ